MVGGGGHTIPEELAGNHVEAKENVESQVAAPVEAAQESEDSESTYVNPIIPRLHNEQVDESCSTVDATIDEVCFVEEITHQGDLTPHAKSDDLDAFRRIMMAAKRKRRPDSTSKRQVCHRVERNKLSSNTMCDVPCQKIPPGSRLVASGGILRNAAEVSIKAGPTLVVCPASLVHQWADELQLHAGCCETSRGGGGRLQLILHLGTVRSRQLPLHLSHRQLVLTSYGTLVSEWGQHSAVVVNENGGKAKRKGTAAVAGANLFQVHWRRVVLDEAHIIKTRTTQVARAAFALRSEIRWAVTGTPIQNSVDELYSLLHFLGHPDAEEASTWNKLMQKPGKIDILRSTLRPIMLRRTMQSMDGDGKPIVSLPPRKTRVRFVAFSTGEADYYKALHTRSKTQFDEYVDGSRMSANYATVLELLLRLRQACDHPFLAQSRADTSSSISALSKHVKRRAAEGGGGQHIDALVNKIQESLEPQVGPNDPTRDTPESEKDSSSECPICLEPLDDTVVTACAHEFCRECILTLLSHVRTTAPCPLCREPVTRKDLMTLPRHNRFEHDIQDESMWKSSAKLNALIQELGSESDAPDLAVDNACDTGKAIVFSQWTGMLDLVEVAINRSTLPFRHVRLDGTMSVDDKRLALQRFREDPKTRVLLLSLRAGCVGLNLTSASRVFLLDPWWNTALEEQAIGRVHRIGQTRPVEIIRFIVQGTVEERMLEMQRRKQRTTASIMFDDSSIVSGEVPVRHLTMKELRLCFELPSSSGNEASAVGEEGNEEVT